MKPTIISVIITTINRPNLVVRAINSVLSQTYMDYEIHVVDDGSVDNTSIAVNNLLNGQENAFYWRHDNSRGLSAARNTGIKMSRGEFVAFLDDDDQLKPDSLQKRIEALKILPEHEQENIGVIYSGCEVHLPHEKRVTLSMPRIEGKIAIAIQNIGLSTIPSSGLYPRVALKKIGGFDESLISSIDHDLWMSLALYDFSAIAVHEPLTISSIEKKKKSMVTDTSPRIQGVEAFLIKWAPIYEKWFGVNMAHKYIQRYRTKVLGSLAANKFTLGEWEESWRLLSHVCWHNRYSPKEQFMLIYLIFRSVIREIIPVNIFNISKSINFHD